MASDGPAAKKSKCIVPKVFSTEGGSQNRLCKYIHRYCFQERIHGYDFCIRHILEDKSAPFKQCTYVQQPQRKRCSNAAPKNEKNERREAFCPFHVKQSYMKIKASTIKRRSTEKGIKSLLRSLEHYCSHPQHDPSYSKETDIAEKNEMTPFDEHFPAVLKPPSEFINKNENMTFELVSNRVDTFEDHRDWEFGDKDPLRYAGVLTGKEVLRIARDKAIRLKTLYCDELKRTYYKLKELRREFLHQQKIEIRKNGGKPLPVPKSKKLKILESYHSQLGMHKVVSRKSEQRRLGITPEQSKCIFIEDGKKCNQVAVVCTCYCLNHLALDPNQCLFVQCSYSSKVKCNRPVLPLGDFNVCKHHEYATLLSDSKENGQPITTTDSAPEQEHFQSIDDIASLGLDGVTPGSLFGLDQFGEPGESTDTVLSEEQADLMQIQPITLNPPEDILSDSKKSDIEEEK